MVQRFGSDCQASSYPLVLQQVARAQACPESDRRAVKARRFHQDFSTRSNLPLELQALKSRCLASHPNPVAVLKVRPIVLPIPQGYEASLNPPALWEV